MPSTEADESGEQSAAGDRDDPGFDEAALHRVVSDAVEDAILGVVGTLLLVGIAFVLVVVGGSLAIQSPTPTGIAAGLLAVLGGVYLAAATLEVVPPAREWVR